MASINEKLNYINETKSLIKDKLNDLGSEITNQTTFRDYADKIENLYEEWPKTSDEDIIINLENTKKGKMNLQLKGNINQFTTTGKQLFKKENAYDDSLFNLTRHVSDVSYSNGILTITPTGTGNPRIVIYCNLPAGTYIFNSETSLGSATQLRNDNEDVLYNLQWKYQNQTFTINENATKMWFNLENPQSTTPLTIDLNTLMISINGGDYEPYTGGIASPNPEYPQDIEIVTGENILTIKNKNLFVKTNVHLGYYLSTNGTEYADEDAFASDFIDVSNYTKVQYSGSSADWGNKYRIIYFDKNKNAIDYFATKNRTLNVSTAAYIKIADAKIYLNTIQLEIGETETSYVLGEEQNYTINLGNLELCKINDSQDYIYKNNNKWYKKPHILKITSYNSESISTTYKSTTGSLTTGATIYYINPTTNPNGIEITNTTLINQLNTLEQAMSYNNQTNISQTNDNLPFIITTSALLKNSD